MVLKYRVRIPYLQLFRVNMQDGSLKNTDGVYEMKALPNGTKDFLQAGNVFQGGNWQHLHVSRVVYVIEYTCS